MEEVIYIKVVIGCLNAKYVHASLAPWCLKAGINEYCKGNINAKVMEATINSNIHEYIKDIIAEKPDIVCFSCYIWNIELTLDICKTLKNALNCKIVLGGPEVSYRAENVLESYDFIDIVLSGEGEESLPKLLDIIYFKNDLSTADGVTYRSDKKILHTDEKEYSGTPVSPYTSEFFENINGRIAYIETSRGCPYRCAFCLSGRCSCLRFFDIEQVKRNIIRLANSNTKTIKFIDRTFNANAKRANEIFSFIISNYKKQIPEGVCFHFEIAGDILTEETLDILSASPNGLIQLEIGMQSFNEETLNIINRKTNTAKLTENIKRLVSFDNMHIHIDLIAGLTGEDIKSFEKSFNLAFSLKPHMLQLGTLKLLHGTEMRENKDKYPCTFSAVPPYEVISTPWLTEDEIKQIKRCEDALERMYNSGRFLYTLDYLINECRFTPFKLFMDFGNASSGDRLSLSQYAESILTYFGAFCDKEILKEKIICDLLSCLAATQIPKSFIEYSPLYKKVKMFFNNKTDTSMVALLTKSNQVYVVNTKSNKNLKGRIGGKFYPLDSVML
jgi:radical SAM superfamily enzyme YgiQ (UPF0313 family)